MAALLLLAWMAGPGLSSDGAQYWEEAQAALRARDYARAEELYRKFLTVSPSVPEAHANLGLALHLQKKQEEAIRAFRKAIELNPDLAHAHLFLGINLFNRNETAQALASLERYTSLSPKDAQGHYYLGLALSTRGDFKSAMESLERAADLSPKDVDILYHLAQNYITQANLILQRVAQHDPGLPMLKEWEKKQAAKMDELVRRPPASGKDRERISALLPLLNRTPLNTEAEQLAAIAFANLYLETTRRFYAIDPDSFRIRQLLAAYYEKTSQTGKAIAELENVLATNPNVRGIHFALGSIYKDQSKPELALNHFLKELQIASPDPGTRLQLAQVYLTLQQPQKALAELLICQKTSPDDVQLLRTLGKAYTVVDELEKAAENYEKAIARGEDDHAIHYQLAHVYRKLGKTDLAKREFDASNRAAHDQRERDRLRIQKAVEAQKKESSIRN